MVGPLHQLADVDCAGVTVRDQDDGTAAGLNGSNPPQVSYLTIEQIRAHPRWHLARDSYMQMAVDSHSADPAIRRVMQDIARIVLFNLIISLYEAAGEARSTWPTVKRIREVFEPFGLASPRRFDEMIARMRSIGLIELHPAPSDRRIRLVVPTPAMIAEDYAWHDINMHGLTVLLPESRDYDEVFAHNPLYRKVHRAISTGLHPTARDILDPANNPLVAFLVRQDGTKIVFGYLLAALSDGDPTRVSLSYEAISARIATSRTHVRNLVRALEEAGFMKGNGRGGRDIELLPPLLEQAELFIAGVLSGNDYWWQLTRQRIAAMGQSTQ